MAQNLIIAGASYSDVPAIDIAKSGGGLARFTDTSNANALASDILSGKTAYVNGNLITGTHTEPFGMLLVTYPSGATLTCANVSGYKDISATQRLYYVAAAGTYTATISQTGKRSVSKSAVFSNEGQREEIALVFEFVYFENGVFASENTIWNALIENNVVRFAPPSAPAGTGFFSNSCDVDISSYTTMHVEMYVTNLYGVYGAHVGIYPTYVGIHTETYVGVMNDATARVEDNTVRSDYHELTCAIPSGLTLVGIRCQGLTTNGYVRKIWFD